jgi:hypothetical protein
MAPYTTNVALTPSIPTSFVPKQPVSPTRRPRTSGDNFFLVVALFIFGITIAAAAAIYIYSSYLTNEVKSKAAQVNAAESAVSPGTVEQFIRLRDRLSAGELLLNQHVEFSQFFTLLESQTIQNVQFTGLKLTLNTDRSADIVMTGNARTFNALAAQSTAIASQSDIKSAIFSGIQINKDNTVGFTLDATLDPSLVVESSAPTTPVLLPGSTASSTAATPSFSDSSVQTSALTSTTTTTSP